VVVLTLGLALFSAAMIVAFAALIVVATRAIDRRDRERRQAEHAAREAHAGLKALLDNAPTPMSLRAPDGRFLAINRAAAGLMGKSVEEVLDRQPEELLEPRIATAITDQEPQLGAGGGAVTFELSGQSPDGTEHQWLVTQYPVPGPEGGTLGIGGIALDITERKRAEQALRESKEASWAIIEHANDAFIASDADGHITAWNPAAEQMFGWTRAEALGRTLADTIIPPEHRAAHVAGLARVASGGEPRLIGRRLELAALHRDGRELIVAMTISRGVHRPGHDLYHAFLHDITEQRATQDELRASEERFRLTVDHAPIGIALVSRDGSFLRVNRALCDMTGYAAGELLEKTFQDITHPDDLDSDLGHVVQMLAGEIATYEMEKRYFCADGSIVWVLLSVSLVRDQNGQPLHFVSQIQDISERKRQESELRHLAAHDALTGLANRRALGQEISRQLAHQARYGGHLALLLVDLDHFKHINDTLGHPVGDQVIRAAAGALRTRVRRSDTVARLGGDEFAVLLPHSSLDAAKVVADELVGVLAELRVDTAEQQLRVSASIGVVVVEREEEFDEDAMLAAADLAMYDAKEAGRDRYAVYDPKNWSRTRAGERLSWSHRIRRALQDDTLVLHYQPIVNVSDGSNGCYEALIRMADEPGDPAPPSDFLYIAERYGLVRAVDRWVTRRVITALASGELPAGATIALNVSPRSLTDEGLLELVERLLSDYRIAPQRLIFEVTESAAISRLDEAKRFSRRLQRLGCGFALDDFGSGVGSFFHLKHLPYDFVKIDGDLVRGMTADRNDRLLVQALVGVAKGMGKRTVAEFVGDEQTLALLRELGVDYAQGFHIGHPVPAEDLPTKTTPPPGSDWPIEQPAGGSA
jgi:diguanylate cyclase (GGDEF)-like protein/PAS domain S-box-containing protein